MPARAGSSDHSLQRALSRMLELGYGLNESEFALLRAGGDINEAIEELQSSTQRPPRSQTQPSRTVESGAWTLQRTGPRPRVTSVQKHGPRTVTGIRAKMVVRSAVHKAAHEVQFVADMRTNAAAHRHVKGISAMDTDHATRAEKAAQQRRLEAARVAAEEARNRRHAAMSVRGASVQELNARAKKREAQLSLRPGTKNVTDSLHATKGGFTGTQLTKMDHALGLFSSYLPPDHPVLAQMTQTLQGDEMPILEDKDLDDENSYENPWITDTNSGKENDGASKKGLFDHSGDTSEEEEEAQVLEAAKDGRMIDTSDSGVAAREIAELDPTRYYRQTSSPIAAALEARARNHRNADKNGQQRRQRLHRPATAPAGRRVSERRPTQGTQAFFGRGGVNPSPSQLLLGSMGAVTMGDGPRRRPATARYTRGGGGGVHPADLGQEKGKGFGCSTARQGLHEPARNVLDRYRSAGPGPGGYDVESGIAPGVGGSDWKKDEFLRSSRSGALLTDASLPKGCTRAWLAALTTAQRMLVDTCTASCLRKRLPN